VNVAVALAKLRCPSAVSVCLPGLASGMVNLAVKVPDAEVTARRQPQRAREASGRWAW
jgi:hypothetical protein